jgi:DNA-binding MarR family transcriptional regulator
MADVYNKPGHLIRRFQQIAVGIFHAEAAKAGFDLTPVQYAALASISANPGIDQATLAGLIAYDRATVHGVVDRLVQKELIVQRINTKDRRSRALEITQTGRRALEGIEPAVDAAQRIMLRGLTDREAAVLMKLMRKAIDACNELSRAPLQDSE